MTTQSSWEHAYAKWRKTVTATPLSLTIQALRKPAAPRTKIVAAPLRETPAADRPVDAVSAWLKTFFAPAASSEIAGALGLPPKAVGCALGILSRKGQAKKLPQGWVAVRRQKKRA